MLSFGNQLLPREVAVETTQPRSIPHSSLRCPPISRQESSALEAETLFRTWVYRVEGDGLWLRRGTRGAGGPACLGTLGPAHACPARWWGQQALLWGPGWDTLSGGVGCPAALAQGCPTNGLVCSLKGGWSVRPLGLPCSRVGPAPSPGARASESPWQAPAHRS